MYIIHKYLRMYNDLHTYYVHVFVLVKRMTSLSEFSRPESDASTWEDKWAESSLFANSTADGHGDSVDLDDTSSVLTTSTMPISEYQRRIRAADTQLTAKTHNSILKKK